MPEATVHKDDAAPLRQNYIRPAKNVFGMNSEAITEPMEHRSHSQLWIGVAAFNAGHIPAAMLL